MPTTWAQLQNAVVSVRAETSSHLETIYGTNDRSEWSGDGAFPQFLGSANSDQTSGPSGVQARSQLGLEMSESGLTATGFFFISITPDEGFLNASASALSRIWIDFTLPTARTWRIDPGMAAGPEGNTLVSLSRGATQIFAYSGEFSGAHGQLEPGVYRFAITSSADIESSGVPNETSGMYSVGLMLGDVNPCPADFNHDSVVDDFDFLIFLADYDLLLCDDPGMLPGCPCDLNHDSDVNDEDFSIFIVAYDALECP
ncbi:MAG: hypothetical protein KF691_02005 [Phycisphaeraceae bacterium]|nr:hypothetical protein [Phycisphaeraceae bacterium]